MAGADFVDECRIFVAAGDGGRGCSSFRREKFVPKGGPDGGNGGSGGSVVLIGDRGKTTLTDAKHHRHCRAARGVHGKGARKDGRGGADFELRVPLGTVVRDEASTEVMAEVLEHEQHVIVARGGGGGRGNACFATSTQRAPVYAEPGEPGETRWLRLELKVMADVGLLGFPNAGKSTLIRAVSEAKPKVASYAFTTLAPTLGVVQRDDVRFVMADIPGLIPGAHQGAGLGDRFLRHVERTRVFVHLLDPEPVLRGEPGRGLREDHAAIRAELLAYSPELGLRHEIVVVSKADLVPARDRGALDAPPGARWISSATGEGVHELIGQLATGVAETTP